MKKTVYNISRFARVYDSERKGAKYQIWDEVAECYKWVNSGELYEVALKWALGYAAHKDANGSYDAGSDIEETHTSVKSWAFTLASACKADSFEANKDKFFKNVASDNFSFGWIEKDELVEYNMNCDEFNRFLNRFCKLDNKVIRGPKFSMKKRTEVEEWFARLEG